MKTCKTILRFGLAASVFSGIYAGNISSKGETNKKQETKTLDMTNSIDMISSNILDFEEDSSIVLIDEYGEEILEENENEQEITPKEVKKNERQLIINSLSGLDENAKTIKFSTIKEVFDFFYDSSNDSDEAFSLTRTALREYVIKNEFFILIGSIMEEYSVIAKNEISLLSGETKSYLDFKNKYMDEIENFIFDLFFKEYKDNQSIPLNLAIVEHSELAFSEKLLKNLISRPEKSSNGNIIEKKYDSSKINLYLKFKASCDFLKKDNFVNEFKTNISGIIIDNSIINENISLPSQTEEMKEVVNSFKNLTKFTISGLKFCDNLKYNNIKQADLISDILKNAKSLKILDLSSSLIDIGNSEMKKIANSIKNLKSLEVLNLSNNQTGNEGIKYILEAIEGIDSIKTIDLSYNNIEEEALERLFHALKGKESLEVINFNGNNIKENGAKYLAKSISHPNSLIKLSLEGNSIQFEGIKHISELLKKTKNLEILDLSYNCYNSEDEAVNLISSLLNNLKKLKTINLSGIFMKKDTISNLSFELSKMEHIENINLSSTVKIEYLMNQNKISMKSNKTVFDFLKHIQEIRSLKTLDLSDNKINEDDIEKIIKFILKMKSLKELNLSDNPIGKNGAKNISKILGKMRSLEILNLQNCEINDSINDIFDVLKEAKSIKKLDLRLDSSNNGSINHIMNALKNIPQNRKIYISLFYIENSKELKNEIETALKDSPKNINISI